MHPGLITSATTVRQHMVRKHKIQHTSPSTATDCRSYCNSIIQCLYYSAPFRENVINFPTKKPLDAGDDPTSLPPLNTGVTNGYEGRRSSPDTLRSPLSPGPQALNSPARKPIVLPGSPGAQTQKPDEKDSPEYRKKLALQAGPLLDMQTDNSSTYGMDESLFTSLKDIFESIIAHDSRIGVVSPHKFLEILRKNNEMFRSAMHQDAHEFLNLLLNDVVDNVEAYSRRNGAMKSDLSFANAMSQALGSSTTAVAQNPDWVNGLFRGVLTSETRCLTCENTSQRDEPFMDLSVDLEAHSSVTSCLNKFSEEEMLCERNKFHCDNCGGLQEAEKRMKIKRLPKILALHLKRFKYTEDMQRLQKLFHRVVYPFHLRLFNTTDDAEDPDRLYELYAVVVHIGGGPYHGHYVSIVKTQDRGWLMFDDELVEPVDRAFVRNFFGGELVPGKQDASQLACAYVLFYQETTLEAIQKEQEMEERTEALRAAESANLAKETVSPVTPGPGFFGNGLRHSQTLQTPMEEDVEQFASLAHAATAPTASPPLRPNGDTMKSSPFLPKLTIKSKDERKAEKERKAAEKEAEAAAREKRMEQIKARTEQRKREEEEFKRAIEESKAMADQESQKNGAPQPPTQPSANGNQGSGLSRFRHGSMSLRQKPGFFSSKDKEKSKLPTPAEAPKSQEATPEKKNRFSIGRKKSTMM